MPITPTDRQEIMELYARYGHLIDVGDAEAWAGLFTPDAAFIIKAREAVPERQFHGDKELIAFCQWHFKERYAGRKLRHTAHNILLEPTEAGATGLAYALVLKAGDGEPPQPWVTGRYMDELVKGEHGWRFRSRTFLPDL